MASASFVLPAAAVPPDPLPSLDLRGYRPPTDPNGTLFMEPASVPAHGDWNLGLYAGYAFRPITLRQTSSGERAFDVIRHQLTGDLIASIGALGRLSFGANLPFALYQSGDTPTFSSTYAVGPNIPPAQALGDLAFTGKLVLVEPSAGEMGGFALALHERFSVPTGNPASYLGEAAVTTTTRFLMEYRFFAVGVQAAAGVKVRAEIERFGCAGLEEPSIDACRQRVGHELPMALGLSFRPQALGWDPTGKYTFFVESEGHLPLYPEGLFDNVGLRALEIGLGGRAQLGELSVVAATSIGLNGLGAPAFRGTLALGWAPRVHDIDHDGVPDDKDQCRELPEDKDNFEDQDGCPDGDNDDDGVPDNEDRCPKQKEDEDGINDEDGCPEGAWGT